jgi:hypothetical protein
VDDLLRRTSEFIQSEDRDTATFVFTRAVSVIRV